MSIRQKASGIWASAAQVYAKEAGAWTECKTGWYKNSSGVWDQVFQNVQEYTLAAAENFVLETYLSDAGASTSAPIVVTVPSGVTIGSVDPAVPAFATGDVSSYENVLLVISGSIQGGGGIGGADEFDVGGIGGDALTVASSLSIHITSTGTVYGGGGGGGHGGRGGWGERTGARTYASPTYSSNYNQYAFGGGIDDCWNYGVWWYGSNKGCGYGTGLRPAGENWKYATDGEDSQANGSRYGVSRYALIQYDNGYGGAGGNGEGYQSIRTDGDVGINGTGGCGLGGAGGNGGIWANVGTGGEQGENGTKYALDGQLDQKADTGDSGVAGGIAGGAVRGASIYCPYLNEGDVKGVETIIKLPPDW